MRVDPVMVAALAVVVVRVQWVRMATASTDREVVPV
jgi:hypothetical protein